MTTVRRVFHWIHFVAASLVVIGVCVQVYLAAGQLFGTNSLSDHQDLGWLVHNIELAVLIAALVAWLPWVDLGWSFALAALGTVQVLLASAEEWTGAIHGVGALLVFVIGWVLVHRDLRQLGLMGARRAEPVGADTPPPLP